MLQIPGSVEIKYSGLGIVHSSNTWFQNYPKKALSAVAYLVAREFVSYKDARDAVGKFNDIPFGQVDLIVPLRALKRWASEGIGVVKWARNCFHQSHMCFIARMLWAVYAQERKESTSGDTVFLSNELIFGDQVGGDLGTLNGMIMMAQKILDKKHLDLYFKYKYKDSKRARRRTDDYFYLSPLYKDGTIVGNKTEVDDDDGDWRYRKLKTYDQLPHRSLVYLRGITLVHVKVEDGEFHTSTRPISSEFWERFGSLRMKFQHDAARHNEEGIDALVIDANNGNDYAGSFLLSQTLQGRVGLQDSVFPFNYGFQAPSKSLRIDVFCRLLDSPLELIDSGEMLLPVVAGIDEKKIGVLTKLDDQYNLAWRDVSDHDELSFYSARAHIDQDEDFYVTATDYDGA